MIVFSRQYSIQRQQQPRALTVIVLGNLPNLHFTFHKHCLGTFSTFSTNNHCLERNQADTFQQTIHFSTHGVCFIFYRDNKNTTTPFDRSRTVSTSSVRRNLWISRIYISFDGGCVSSQIQSYLLIMSMIEIK